MQRQGNTIIEVLLAIAIAAIVVASVSNLVVAVNRIDRSSANKDQALAYAREALDVTANIASTEFGRNSGCTAANTLPGYTSCWVSCPLSGCSASYHLSNSPSWHLVAGSETVGTTPAFTRAITVTDNGNANNKTVSVDVSWAERGQTKHVIEQTVITGWKPL